MSTTRPIPSENPGWSQVEIRVKGHLEPRWSDWLDGLTLIRENDGTTLIEGPVIDQAALFGVINRLRDIALPLISILHFDPAESHADQLPPTDTGRSHNPTEEPAMTTTSITVPTAPTSTYRKTALVVGLLFLLTYITAITAKFFFYPPMFENSDYIVSGGADGRLLWGAFSEIILVIANLGTAVALFPVLKRQHEGLALGFVAARVIECVFICVGILSVLTIVTMREDLAADSAGLDTIGHALVALQEWTFQLGPGFTVGVGNGLILGYLMYRSGLVPRSMAVLGLVGGVGICVSGAAVLFGLVDVGSPLLLAAGLPEFFWELSLGIYLVAKGFKPTPLTIGYSDAR
ncbi:MAG: DUF4386 domain-containing protein [Nocardioides sp.]